MLVRRREGRGQAFAPGCGPHCRPRRERARRARDLADTPAEAAGAPWLTARERVELDVHDHVLARRPRRELQVRYAPLARGSRDDESVAVLRDAGMACPCRSTEADREAS